MAKKEFSHAYLYSNGGHQFLVTVFKQYQRIGGANIEVKSAEIDHTVDINVMSNVRFCIHNELVCHIARTLAHSIRIYSDNEICLETKKGYLCPRSGDISVNWSERDEHIKGSAAKEFNDTKNLKVGERLFAYDGPVITKIKGEA